MDAEEAPAETQLSHVKGILQTMTSLSTQAKPREKPTERILVNSERSGRREVAEVPYSAV